MCSCLFIIGDVLSSARTTKKENKEELFNTFITLKKVQKYANHVQKTLWHPNVFRIISQT